MTTRAALVSGKQYVSEVGQVGRAKGEAWTYVEPGATEGLHHFTRNGERCVFSGGDHGALHLCSFAEADELRLCVQAAYSLADAMIDMDECAGDIPPFVEWQDPNAQHPEAIEA